MDLEGTPPGAAGGDVSEESTLGDGAWPVDDHYFVEPEPAQNELERIGADEEGQIAAPVPAADASRAVAVGLALILLALVLAAAAGAWIVFHPAHSGNAAHASASPPPSRSGGTAPTTTTSSTSSTSTTSTTTTTPKPGVTSPAASGSNGQARVRVPSLVGLRADSAARTIRALGLVPELVLVRSQQPAGTVLAQDPAPRARAPRGSSVRLDVAKNVAKPVPAVTHVRVPDLTGLTVTSARRKLGGLGLHASAVQVSSDRPRHTVVDQSPAAGTSLRKGSTVELKTSSGPIEVTVPSVVGLGQQSAEDQLQAAGLQVTVVDESTTDASQDGMVASQEPQGGAKVTKGSTVTITVDQLGQP
jgi:PASTA domain